MAGATATMTAMIDKAETLAQAGCDRELIHIPGSIQPHGTLLVLDTCFGRVRHIAANAPGVFGRGIDELLGAGLDDLFTPDDLPAICAVLDDPSDRKEPSGARPDHATEREVASRCASG